MKRVATALILLASLVLGTAAVAGVAERAESVAPAAAAGTAAPTTLTVWVGWSARELNEFKKVVAEYDRKNAAVQVKVVGGINDDKIIAAIRGGNAPDVVSSFTSANVGVYCPSGGWVDLDPYLKRDRIDKSIFPAATMYYTQYEGKRCALPLLADVYGFYYNKALFKAAGLTRPPRTLGELASYAKKLTKKNPDGSLKVVGYNPFFGFYQNTVGAYQPLVNAQWFKGGKSALGQDAKWQKLLRWQKQLVDYYGHKNLVKWNAGAGDEFSASHAFETGKLAMMMDGEWRVAFIAAEHPELQYGTAPMPVDGAQPSLYGSGYINGTIIGIPKSAKNKDASWALVKYLTTDSHALAQFSNGIRNVPSTRAAAQSKELKPDANFATFTRIFANSKSQTTPITSAGSAYLDTFANFLAKWQSGKVSGLQSGLQGVDKQIDAKLKQSGGGPP